MELTVISITEREDGSADVEIRMDEETKLFLINHAFVDILKEAADRFKMQFDDTDGWDEMRADIVGQNGNKEVFKHLQPYSTMWIGVQATILICESALKGLHYE